MRRLNYKEEREMGFTGSNSKLTKKLKPPKKVLRECNMVDHVSVPRKLRSAMKKRSHESASPPLPDKKIPKVGEECKKKIRRKVDMENEPITKDEEEAVETLISLAEMFPKSNNNYDFKSDSAEAKSPTLESENEESVRETLEVKSSIVQSVSLTNSEQFVHEDVAASERTPEIEVAIGAAIGSLLERQLTTDTSKIIGLWPGLSSAVSLGEDTKGSPVKNASKIRPTSSKGGTLIGNKSWKRCIAHVHISHLIKGLQTAEKTKNNPMQPLNQLIENEKPKQEAHTDKSVSKISSFVAEKDQNETKNTILLHKRLLQDQHQPSKPSFNFLSLSNGSGAVEAATKSVSKTGNFIEPWTQFHIPYLQSITQNQINTPFSLPHNYYSTAPLADYFPGTAAKQVQVQMQSHASSPIPDLTHLANASVPSQHQRRIWASQFASRYKPTGHNNPNMQNRKLDPSASDPFAQSLELLHPMYIPLTLSSPSSRAKMPHHHHLPFGC